MLKLYRIKCLYPCPFDCNYQYNISPTYSTIYPFYTQQYILSIPYNISSLYFTTYPLYIPQYILSILYNISFIYISYYILHILLYKHYIFIYRLYMFLCVDSVENVTFFIASDRVCSRKLLSSFLLHKTQLSFLNNFSPL